MNLSILKKKRNFLFDYGSHRIKDQQVTGLFLTIVVITSIMFIFGAQVIFTPGPGFKIFIDIFKYTVLMIGLPFSALIIGHNSWTPYAMKYRDWWRKNARLSIFNFYFWAIIFMIIGLITLAILKATHSPYFPGDKYWALIPTVGMLPLQNFSAQGTSFTIALIWFNLLLPYIIKGFNKMSFAGATIFIATLLLVAAFIGSWNNVFSHYHSLQQQYPWFNNVTKYLKVEVIFAYLFLGMYIRKFIRNGNWKVHLSLWVALSCSLFIIETVLNQVLHNNKFFISVFPGEIISTIMIIFAFGFLSNVSFHHRFTITIHHKRIAWINKTALMLIGDMFMIILPVCHYIDGYLVGVAGLHLTMVPIGSNYYMLYPQTQLLVIGSAPDATGWIMMGASCLAFIPLFTLGLLRNYLYKKLDKALTKWHNKREQVLSIKKEPHIIVKN
ncbi:hypothetical protein [Ureaplasma ceti]|uniref:Permease n=1 Tax=Ureaplasma ceti TaxID=3119530 RepID=A0ABP9UDT4_9BACT